MNHSQPIEILVVDDDLSTTHLFSKFLREANYSVQVANTLDEAKTALRSAEHKFAVVVSDLRLSAGEGTSLIPVVKELPSPPTIIFITGFGSVDSAVDAIHEGAFDYISKPDNLNDIQGDLLATVARAIKDRDSSHGRRVQAPAVSDENVRTLMGSSSAMVKIYRVIARASSSRENVLISGESGTGKELVARAIHEKSPWADRAFVTVNCCALTETLLESELFGHVRGSFTGASQNKKGLFEEADGGTLFLDEIGDISQTLQVKLLRAIQEGEIKPVGSNETRKVDVRLIAATNRDLAQFVQEGKFREDLYYRLKVILLEMPPLRDRTADIPELVNYFIGRYVQRTGKRMNAVSTEVLDLLTRYGWPGNIRELENAITRAAAMSNTTTLFPEDFPPEFHQANEVPVGAKAASKEIGQQAVSHVPEPDSVEDSLEDIERRHIARVLQSVNYNKSKAALILGIDRMTLYRKAFKYGILPKSGSANTGTD